jgi:hypothetical protein
MPQSKGGGGGGDEAYPKTTEKILHKFVYFTATYGGNQYMGR